MDILELVHEDRSSSSRPFVCSLPECSKDFARRSDLVRHLRIHSNDRPWKCTHPGCRREFIQRSALTVHFRVHTGERPHPCETPGCDKTFSDSSSLARHRRIHTGMRPYRCSVKPCQKTFCRKTTLTKHIRRQHPGSPTSPNRAQQLESVSSELLPPLPVAARRSGRTRRIKSPIPSDIDTDEEDGEHEGDDYEMKAEDAEPEFCPADAEAGVHYDNPQMLATPVQGEVAYFPLPAQSEPTLAYHYTHSSVHDVALQRSLSAPSHPQHTYGYSIEQHTRRRESGEAAYMTPPPRERYLAEMPWEGQQHSQGHYEDEECHAPQLATPVIYAAPRHGPPQTRISPLQRRVVHTARTVYQPRSRPYPEQVYASAPASYGVHQAAYPELTYEPIPPTPTPAEFAQAPHDALAHEHMYTHNSPRVPTPSSFDGSPEPQMSHSTAHFSSPYAGSLPRRASSAAPEYTPPPTTDHFLPASTGLGLSLGSSHRRYSDAQDYPFLDRDDDERPAPAAQYSLEQHRRLSTAVGGSGMGDRFGQIAAGLPVPSVGMGARPSFSTLVSEFSGTVAAY